jgi:CheY-like chemotaxis protein
VSADADRPRVLVVDDERSVADVFAEHLRPTYEVESVYAGADAVTALDDAPDVLRRKLEA